MLKALKITPSIDTDKSSGSNDKTHETPFMNGNKLKKEMSLGPDDGSQVNLNENTNYQQIKTAAPRDAIQQPRVTVKIKTENDNRNSPPGTKYRWTRKSKRNLRGTESKLLLKRIKT